MTLFYLLMLTVVALVIYGGYDETMKLFAYIDLNIRYFGIKMRMKWMGWKLKRRLIKDTPNIEKFLKEYKNGRQ